VDRSRDEGRVPRQKNTDHLAREAATLIAIRKRIAGAAQGEEVNRLQREQKEALGDCVSKKARPAILTGSEVV